MKFLYARFFACALALLACFFVHAANLPSELSGNWNTTEGANRFVLGLTPGFACYSGHVWRIASVKETNGNAGRRWLLALERDHLHSSVLLYEQNKTIWIEEGSKRCALSQTPKNDYGYKRPDTKSKVPVFAPGWARVEILLRQEGNGRSGEGNVNAARSNVSDARSNVSAAGSGRVGRSLQDKTVLLSYVNSITYEEDVFAGQADSLGVLRMNVPLNRTQLVRLVYGTQDIGSFLLEPGDTVALVYNQQISVDGPNPDYDRLGQRIALMGAHAEFNNRYQHFLRYAGGLGYPDFKMPAGATAGGPVSNAGSATGDAGLVIYYADWQKRLLASLEAVYPASKTDPVFTDYIKADIRYALASSLMGNLRSWNGKRTGTEDSVNRGDFYRNYLASDDIRALMHDRYYDLAKLYSSWLADPFSYHSRDINFGRKFRQRVKVDLAGLLPSSFIETYEAINQDREKGEKLSEADMLQRYFHGSSDSMEYYDFMKKSVDVQISDERRDSLIYAVYAGIANPVLHFASNLQLLNNSYFGDDCPRVLTLYRLDIFRAFSQIDGMPWREADSVNRVISTRFGRASVAMKTDKSMLMSVSREVDWQGYLQKKYRGKVVVTWLFSHHFKKNWVVASLYEMQQMRARYRGQNVVFVKCIQQRHRGDNVRQLMEYLKYFSSQGELNDIAYVETITSVQALCGEDPGAAIYDGQGRVHQVQPYQSDFIRWSHSRGDSWLGQELDAVLGGRGNYVSCQPFVKGLGGQHWILYDSTGGYFTFQSEEPRSLNTDYKSLDSVLYSFSVHDSLWTVQNLVLHRVNYQYYPVYGAGARYGMVIDKAGESIALYDDRRRLSRRFKPVFWSQKMMVLQLVE